VKARIRRADPKDHTSLFELESHFPSDRMSRRTTRRMLGIATARVWVAEIDVDGLPRVVAALILLLRSRTQVARIYSVVVADEARGQGLAQRLVARAEKEARSLAKKAITLEVREDNVAARGLYAKLGYSEANRLPKYYDDGADGLRLRKDFRRASP